MKMPFFNRSTRDYLGPDIYDETQQLTDARDQYESFQEDLRPKTYREKYAIIFRITTTFKAIFPFLSAATLLGLVIFLSFDIEAFLTNTIDFKGWIIGIISLLGCLFLVGLNETIKTRSLSEIFYQLVRKVQISWKVISRALTTTMISIIGSAIGLFLITYQITDQSGELKQSANQQKTTAQNAWRNDSLRIVSGYEPIIAQKRETINSFHPTKFRTKRNQLNDEIIQLTNKMESELRAAKDDRLNTLNQAESQLANGLIENDNKASERGWIAFGLIVFLELLNIYCHFFSWEYKARCTKEGIDFGALETSSAKTAYEIQLQRLGAFLQSSGQTFVIPQIQTQKMEPKKIGFEQGHKESPKDDSKDKNTSSDLEELINKIAEKIDGLSDKKTVDSAALKSVDESRGKTDSFSSRIFHSAYSA